MEVNNNTRRIMSADGIRLHYWEWLPEGESKGVLAVVHGWSDYGGRYHNVVNHFLPEGYTIYAIDLRGHGHSDGQRGHIMNWQEYRDDVTAFLSMIQGREKGRPIFLYAHSNGGLIGLDYLIRYPQVAIKGAIISAPLVAPPKVPGILVFLGKILSRIIPRLSLNPGADPGTLSRDPEVIRSALSDPLQHWRATPRFSTEMTRTQTFVLGNVHAIRTPVLLIYGSADGLVPPQISREMFEAIGAADKSRIEYEGGYHELHNDIIKAQVLSDVQSWIEQHL